MIKQLHGDMSLSAEPHKITLMNNNQGYQQGMIFAPAHIHGLMHVLVNREARRMDLGNCRLHKLPWRDHLELSVEYLDDAEKKSIIPAHNFRKQLRINNQDRDALIPALREAANWYALQGIKFIGGPTTSTNLQNMLTRRR